MTCHASRTLTSSLDAAVYISVSPAYLPEKNLPGKYWFSYHITIENRGGCVVQLLSRDWRIIDGDNHVRTVSGDGVIGQQPLINTGEQYEYTSYVDFSTPVGYMEGSYTMVTGDGRCFEAVINLFTLSVPGTVN